MDCWVVLAIYVLCSPRNAPLDSHSVVSSFLSLPWYHPRGNARPSTGISTKGFRNVLIFSLPSRKQIKGKLNNEQMEPEVEETTGLERRIKKCQTDKNFGLEEWKPGGEDDRRKPEYPIRLFGAPPEDKQKNQEIRRQG